jgi:hypothetical protein
MQKTFSATVAQLVDSKFKDGREGQPPIKTPQMKVELLRGNAFSLKVVSTNFEIAREYQLFGLRNSLSSGQERKFGRCYEAKLQQQISTYEGKLEQAERALDEFRKNNVSSIQDAGLEPNIAWIRRNGSWKTSRWSLRWLRVPQERLWQAVPSQETRRS